MADSVLNLSEIGLDADEHGLYKTTGCIEKYPAYPVVNLVNTKNNERRKKCQKIFQQDT